MSGFDNRFSQVCVSILHCAENKYFDFPLILKPGSHIGGQHSDRSPEMWITCDISKAVTTHPFDQQHAFVRHSHHPPRRQTTGPFPEISDRPQCSAQNDDASSQEDNTCVWRSHGVQECPHGCCDLSASILFVCADDRMSILYLCCLCV